MDVKTKSKDQTGAALVIALIMIIVLTLIGLASTFTSTFEISLSGNKRLSTDAFYEAETLRTATSAPNIRDIKDKVDQGDHRIEAYAKIAEDDTPLTQDERDSGLEHEYVDRRWKINDPNSITQLKLPSGKKNFNTGSTITIYRTKIAEGEGQATQAFTYIIDSTGKDSIVSNNIVKSTCQVREKLVLHSPSADESQ
jgi:hypothetical protein